MECPVHPHSDNSVNASSAVPAMNHPGAGKCGGILGAPFYLQTILSFAAAFVIVRVFFNSRINGIKGYTSVSDRDFSSTKSKKNDDLDGDDGVDDDDDNGENDDETTPLQSRLRHAL